MGHPQANFLQPHEYAGIRIDLSALANNYRALRSIAGNAEVAGVVKADGYGLGAPAVIETLLSEGCRRFFVATICEGIEARAVVSAAALPNAEINGEINAEIFVLGGVPHGAEPEMLAHRLAPVLHFEAQMLRWLEVAAGEPCAVHLDTAMNRLGLHWQQLCDDKSGQLAATIRALQPQVIMSHMACADEPDHPLNQQQIERFGRALECLTGFDIRGISDAGASGAHGANGSPRLASTISLANSACLLHNRWPADQLARPGIALYGANPCAAPLPITLNPVAQVHARLLEVRDVAPAQSVGYGATWVAARPSKVGIIGAGYADGIKRSLSYPALTPLGSSRGAISKLSDAGSVRDPLAKPDRPHVYIGEHPCPIIGRVSMDTLAIDLTDIAANLDTICEVEILGRNISAEIMAKWAGTCAYEILTGLRGRLRREYISA